MKDVMLDFETFGTGPNKCICQVAAIYFDNATGAIGREFKANIDAASHQKYGAKLDASTVYWWLAQSDAARESILAADRKPIHEVFGELYDFLQGAKRVWSHATFDFVALMDTYAQLNMKAPVSYKSGMDIRTLVYLAGTTMDQTLRAGTHHDALDDCRYQVKYCVEALNAIKTAKTIIKFAKGLED